MKGNATVRFDRKPSGGCLTNGIETEGEIDIVVPGGRASLPSFVIHSTLLCLECGTFSLASPSWWFGDAIGRNTANAKLRSTFGTVVSISDL